MVWRILTSVRLTLILIAYLSLLSVLGTVVAQQGQTQVPIETLYSPRTLKVLYALGLTDVFHSASFVLGLLLWALNLIACSVERLPKIWRQTFHVAPPPVEKPTLSDWSIEEARKFKYVLERPGKGAFSSVAEARMATELFFQKKFGSYSILRDSPEEFQIMLERQKYSRLGVYITHLSLLLIFSGGVIGALFGFEGAMSIEEGTRVAWMQHAKGSNGGMWPVIENGIPVKGFLSLNFEVECEKFTLETYDGTRPKAFKSMLHFYENDVKVHSAEIAVNHPTVYKGITFYQASYNELGPGTANITVIRKSATTSLAEFSHQSTGAILSGLKKGLSERVENVRPQDTYRIDGDAAFRILRLEKNLMELGPAVQIEYFASRGEKRPETFWIFKDLPGFDLAHRKNTRHHFIVEAINPLFATGLSVARDPGVWIVWLGSLILVCALFLALYTCHHRVWVAYTEETGFVFVGWSNKLFLFEPRFQKWFSSFREELKL